MTIPIFLFFWMVSLSLSSKRKLTTTWLISSFLIWSLLRHLLARYVAISISKASEPAKASTRSFIIWRRMFLSLSMLRINSLINRALQKVASFSARFRANAQMTGGPLLTLSPKAKSWSAWNGAKWSCSRIQTSKRSTTQLRIMRRKPRRVISTFYSRMVRVPPRRLWLILLTPGRKCLSLTMYFKVDFELWLWEMWEMYTHCKIKSLTFTIINSLNFNLNGV